MSKIPSPKERPDLYDSYDGAERPAGWVNPVKTSPRLQKLIDQRKKQKKANK